MPQNLKYYFSIFLLVGFSSNIVLADGLSQDDMTFAFSDAVISHDMELLSSQEMIETEGNWGLWGAAGGAGIGAWNYLGNSIGTGRFSWSGLGHHVVVGAGLGAVTGPIGISRYYFASRLSGAAGFTSGYGSRRG